MVGAVPVFADIDARNYCLDPLDCARKITPRTRAMIPVHLGGQMADMPALKALAQRHRLAILEDSAQAIGACWAGRNSGAWGDVASFSFQSNKTLTSGEGGLVATDDEALAGRSWPTALLAASAPRRRGWGIAPAGSCRSGCRGTTVFPNGRVRCCSDNWKNFPATDAKRQNNAAYLTRQLAKLKGIEHIRIDAEGSKHAYYYYLVRYDPSLFGEAPPNVVAGALAAEGVPFIPGDSVPYRHPVFHPDNLKNAVPVETLEHYRRAVDLQDPRCPVAEAVCHCTLILRHQVLLAEQSDMDDIAEAVAKVQAHAHELAYSQSRCKSMIDLHTHTFFSDGTLCPAELMQRAEQKGLTAVALTDHADPSNLEQLLERMTRGLEGLRIAFIRSRPWRVWN